MEVNNANTNLIGKISSVFFESPDSLFKVVLVTVKEDNFDWDENQIVVTGNMTNIVEGNTYQFEGKIVSHPKYGQQFSAAQVKSFVPESKEGLVNYLSSSKFKGIGIQSASKVVKKLGKDAIKKIKQDSSVLVGLGLTKKQQASIVDGITESNGLEDILIKLGDFGITGIIASNVINKYHEDTLKIIEENPYHLSNEIESIGFKKADEIAHQLGFKDDFEPRIQAGILETILKWCLSTGDTYIKGDNLVQQASKLLGSQIDFSVIAEQVINLGELGQVVGDQGNIYLSWLYRSEVSIANKVKSLLAKEDVDDSKLDQAINEAEANVGIEYDDVQKNAIKLALSNKITIITGGPGTGKTTIVKGLIESFANLHRISLDEKEYTEKSYPVQLAAPTGRAAKRMNEVTGVPARTIHRLLGLNGNDEIRSDEIEEITGDLLVVDEMSMVDTNLFDLLISAVNYDMQVVLVGDSNQLPSVGPGQVFNDLICSKTIPTISLTKIYRQGQDSSIINLAHDIQKGELPADFEQNKPDKSYFNAQASQVTNAIEQIAKRAVSKGISKNDIQVLAPMYRGSAGVNEINLHLQKVLNPIKTPNDKHITVRDVNYRIGDKVLQLVNAPENNIFNGDIGEIVSITTGKKAHGKDSMIVDFDGNEVTYGSSDFNQLTLAYCISIHKSQGSEFPFVIMPMVRQYYRMLQRNLLYTGLTRASKSIILLGELSAFETAVENESANRNTGLIYRLNDELKPAKNEKNDDEVKEPDLKKEGAPKDFILTNKLIVEGAIDPMIGMANIKP